MDDWKIFGANVAILLGLVFAVAAIIANAKYRAELLSKACVLIAITNIVVGLAVHLEKQQEVQDASIKAENSKDEQKISAMGVGTVLNGRHSDSGNSLFSRAFTSIETDKGVYKVAGTHIVTKGQELEIQLRASGSEYLCVSGHDGSCMRLIN